MKFILIGTLFVTLLGAVFFVWRQDTGSSLVESLVPTVPPLPTATATPTPTVPPIPAQYEIPQRLHVYQTFNNCGPASLSMLLSYNNMTVTQQELGQKLRPYQHPTGDNDDKSVTIEEIAIEAATYNLTVYHRRHGSVETLKQLIAQDIPVLVRTWLHPNEDIGHYRIVRGYDDTAQQFIQDDSYEGDHLRYSYAVFNELWQPFNYEYLIAIPSEKDPIARRILGDDVDEQTAWQYAYDQALVEHEQDPENPYPLFNQVVALYHLGRYEEAVPIYETVQYRVPSRMLWYQIEPIQSYLQVRDYDRVFMMTDAILNNHNRAFTELYLIRGRAYQAQGDQDAARDEFEKAVFYNKNSVEAHQALNESKLTN